MNECEEQTKIVNRRRAVLIEELNEINDHVEARKEEFNRKTKEIVKRLKGKKILIIFLGKI